MPAEKVVINRLHVHETGPTGPVGLRLGLEQALSQLRPRPAQLPPQAILVVRRLAAPPAFGLRPGERRRWQEQLEAQLEQLARQAARPSCEHVPPQANTVLFADPVELLLCWARDLLAGRWTWYWNELFPAAGPNQPFGHRLLAACLAHPQALPHALVSLEPAAAAAILDRLNQAELSHLAHSLHDTFALPRGALDAAVTETAVTKAFAPGVAVPAGHTVAPWRDWLPAGPIRHLSPPAVYILGLSYTLVRRPDQAHRPEFGDQASRWLEAALVARQAPVRPPQPKRSRPGAASRLPEPDSAATGTISSDQSPFAAGFGQNQAASEEPVARPGAEGAITPFDAAALTDLGHGTFTRLGGAVYFVNLLTRLGLPNAIPNLASLNPWELLGGLAVALLGESAEKYADDPLWAALNELAGLAPDQPWGASLPLPAAFQLPATWVDRLPPQQILAHRHPDNDRLQLWTAGPGYLLADLPADASLTAWPLLDRQLAAPVTLEDLPRTAGRRLSSHLAWWVRRLRPFLACYLTHLLGMDDQAAAVETLFHQPATLYLSPTHLDLVQSVEQISLPLRRAGLDQTPGWRPEFGYIITVHFE
jgi:hypothetical protein